MSDQIRLDKWLWAARFFKTRGLAQKAIEGGKVHYNGGRVKPSKAVEVGARLDIPQGWARMEIEVLGVTDKRRSAPEAQALYHETEASAERRQQEAENRRLNNQIMQPPKRRPDRRDRRDIQRFQRQMSDD